MLIISIIKIKKKTTIKKFSYDITKAQLIKQAPQNSKICSVKKAR